MKYLVYIVVALVSVILTLFSWQKLKAINIESERDKKRFSIITAIFTLISVCMFLFIDRYEYEYVSVGKLALTYWIISAVTLTDIKEHIIPNKILILGGIIRLCILALEWIMINNIERFKPILISSLLGLVISFIALFIVSLLTKGGIGFGDVKLFMFIGFSLGLRDAYAILFYSLIFMTFYMIIKAFMKKINRKSQIPMAPFVYLGYVFIMFIGGL